MTARIIGIFRDVPPGAMRDDMMDGMMFPVRMIDFKRDLDTVPAPVPRGQRNMVQCLQCEHLQPLRDAVVQGHCPNCGQTRPEY